MGVPKFHVPDFDGSSDPLQWLHRCNQGFDAWKTTEEDKMWFATLRLTGVAYQWYCKIERNRGMPTWEQFAGKISRRFAQVPAPVKPNAPSGTVAPEATAADTSSPKGTSSGSSTWNRCPAGLRISAAGLCFHPGNPDLLATADPNSATVGVATFSTSIFTPCAITGKACCSVIAANNPGGASGYSSVRSLW